MSILPRDLRLLQRILNRENSTFSFKCNFGSFGIVYLQEINKANFCCHYNCDRTLVRSI